MPIRQIQSSKNVFWQPWRKWLQRPSMQRREGVLLMEGDHGVMLGLQKGFNCRYLIADEHLDLAELTAFSSNIGEVIQCPSKVISSLSSLHHIEGKGMLAVFDYPEIHEKPPQKDDILVLDRLQDPGNVGTLLRTAAAFGFKWVYAMTGTVALWHPKVVRAGQGVHFQLNLVEDIAPETLTQFQIEHGSGKTFLLAAAGESYASEATLNSPQCWVLGHEGEGVQKAFYALPHKVIAVPMPGRVESLNVATAGAILFYEQWRQRHQ